MSRLFALIILALVGFYVAWPAWSGYQIKAALDAGDTTTLARKIEFERVRASLRPAVAAEVEKSLAAAVSASGQPPATLDKLKSEAMPKLVDMALNGLVTPEGVARIYRERKDIKTAVATIVAENLASPEGLVLLGSIAGSLSTDKASVGNVLGQLGKLAEQSGVDTGKLLGGLFGKPKGGAEQVAGGKSPAASTPTPASPSSDNGFGIDNIKSFAMSGPTGYVIGVAKDKAARAPEVLAEMAFTGGDWKLVGIVPKT